MVQFIDVDPAKLIGHREGRRGRVSYPILKSFLETGKPAAQLDRTGMQQSLMSLNSCLNTYIKTHKLPIKLLQRSGEIYLVRLDMDENGDFIDDWKPSEATPTSITTDGNQGYLAQMEPKPITSDEVSRRFYEERGRVTK